MEKKTLARANKTHRIGLHSQLFGSPRRGVLPTLTVAVMMGLVVASASGQNCHAPLFLGQTFPPGDKPSSVTAADLDSDGDTDLAVANWESGDVSVLMNQCISTVP